MAATYDKHNVSLTAALSTLEKVGGDTGPRGKGMFSLMFLTLYRMTELLSEFEKEASDAEDDPLEAEEPVHRTALWGSSRGAEEGQEDVPENSHAPAQVWA